MADVVLLEKFSWREMTDRRFAEEEDEEEEAAANTWNEYDEEGDDQSPRPEDRRREGETRVQVDCRHLMILSVEPVEIHEVTEAVYSVIFTVYREFPKFLKATWIVIFIEFC